jgi:hypothetical protein
MSGSAGAFGRPFKYWVRRAALRIIERAPLPVIPKWTVVRGDTVTILSGRSAGKSGKVKAVLRRKNRVVVEGLNLVRPSRWRRRPCFTSLPRRCAAVGDNRAGAA